MFVNKSFTKLIYTYITNTIATIISNKSSIFKTGFIYPNFPKNTILCFNAIALITKGKVKAEKLGLNPPDIKVIALYNANKNINVAIISIATTNTKDLFSIELI